MERRDRLSNLLLLAAAVAAWGAVALFFTTRSPTGQPDVQAIGAVALGVAVGLTCLPLFWMIVFAAHGRIAYRGDWARAIRRASLVGFVVTIMVLLIALGAASLPLVIFVVVLAVFVEVILTARR